MQGFEGVGVVRMKVGNPVSQYACDGGNVEAVLVGILITHS